MTDWSLLFRPISAHSFPFQGHAHKNNESTTFDVRLDIVIGISSEHTRLMRSRTTERHDDVRNGRSIVNEMYRHEATEKNQSKKNRSTQEKREYVSNVNQPIEQHYWSTQSKFIDQNPHRHGQWRKMRTSTEYTPEGRTDGRTTV